MLEPELTELEPVDEEMPQSAPVHVAPPPPIASLSLQPAAKQSSAAHANVAFIVDTTAQNTGLAEQPAGTKLERGTRTGSKPPPGAGTRK